MGAQQTGFTPAWGMYCPRDWKDLKSTVTPNQAPLPMPGLASLATAGGPEGGAGTALVAAPPAAGAACAAGVAPKGVGGVPLEEPLGPQRPCAKAAGRAARMQHASRAVRGSMPAQDCAVRGPVGQLVDLPMQQDQRQAVGACSLLQAECRGQAASATMLQL